MKKSETSLIDYVRRAYPPNTRVELLFMDDPLAPPVHTQGTVTGVDDMGNILVNWDNGSTLNVIYGFDEIRTL